MEKKRVKLTIDGKEIEVDDGISVFQAAVVAGIYVPHYCYHPDLSVAGVCRMCLVEIDKVPRLQISCNTPVKEGMVVATASQKARDAQKGSLELHLINHPLDCPICDKAGECKLQDIYRDFGLYKSRMEYENKVHKPKVQDIGTIMLDAERCILCARCTRFTDEVTKTNELVFVNRGDRTTLKTFDDGPLQNEYTGNLADICPVGALTAKDFRFQQRVWFLDKTDSVCTQCARGCNTQVSYNPKTKKLYRVEPRRNVEVNKSWICDKGRWDYHYVYAENRIKFPLEGATKSESTWHHVFGELNARSMENPKSILVLLSTQLTNEELADAKETLPFMGITQMGWLVDESKVGDVEPYDGILKHRDPTANAAGFQKIFEGAKNPVLDLEATSNLLAGNEVTEVWLLGLEGNEFEWVTEKLPGLLKKRLVVHATNQAPWMESATLLLPNVSSFEKSGTVVNALGRLQKVQQAIPTAYLGRDLHRFLTGLREGGDRAKIDASRFADIFAKKVAPVFLKEAQTWRSLSVMGVSR